ncbi:MAG: hypothetical protein PHR83_07660 [Paludibacter sp.]|nr:hypothetical protein [Paludibacter sp.]
MKLKLIVLLILFIFLSDLSAQKDSIHITFNGKVTAWGIAQVKDPAPVQFRGRFVPTVLGDFKVSPNSKLDFEASLNINGTADFTGLHYDTVMGQFKPYRVWARYSGQNWEVRAGLQKINFGSAKMFRPLMWFDGMDVRDPLQLTDGVYGLLGKYFFENNANLWAWGLIGNKNPKGYELWGTAQWKPEIGGRFQMPAGPGEIAISTHHRKIQYQKLFSSTYNLYETNESRIGLDGKWDLGVGLWFESSVTMTDTQNNNFPLLNKVQDMWSLGVDYTFPVGNGIGATVEYFRYHAGDQFIVNGNARNVLGTMLSYPISMLDNLSGMVFYLPGQNKFMNYLSWSRTYDNFNIYGIGYWNPENVQLMAAQSQNRNMFAGKGIQIMVSYNF